MHFASHSAIAPFTLHRPSTSAEAIDVMRAKAGAAFLAGGVDLVPALRDGTPAPDIISLSGLADLAAIRSAGDVLQIGAAATFDQLQSHADAASGCPELAGHAAEIGNVRVRCAATLGGNLASRNAGYDLLPLLLASDATIRVLTPDGERHWECAPGFVGWVPDGLIERIDLPLNRRNRLRYERRFKPVASVALGLWRDDDGWRGRAVVGCAFDRFWMANLPEGVESPEAAARNARGLVAQMTANLPVPEDDTAASGGYRVRLIKTLMRRQLESLAA